MGIKQAWVEIKKVMDTPTREKPKRPDEYKMSYCKGCGKLFNDEDLINKGDSLYCTGCQERD